ncbi:MAG: ABC transporter ATP-binding protein [Lachnospiraceae bacterium]|nr:ABC transporter ATP-binding protein [Lachnospiraceae bacterium]
MSHLLEVNGLTTAFSADYGETVSVDHISFHVDEGETVCIVGESGCGKSVTSLSIMGLLGKGGAVKDGSVLFDGKNLLEMTEKELDGLRGNRLSMIFQDPLTSLNPVFTVGNQIVESIRTHMDLSKEEANERAIEILAQVGMPDPKGAMKKYPHTLSGGMRQRVMIAMALCCEPALLIADEPTTALDVTIQAQIMSLLKKLREEIGMSMILITHDIGLVARMADRVIVMYAGQLIEEAPVKELFAEPRHPYTRALLATVPSIYDKKDRVLESIPGIVPENYDSITGCRFADRCPYRRPECDAPQQDQCINAHHKVRCWRAVEQGIFEDGSKGE